MKIDVIYNKSSQRMDELPDECIDMLMTSPPYWGLRDYGEDVKEIWGGDPDCEHEFENYVRPAGGGHANPDKAQVGTTKKDIQRVFGAKASFCQKCGAWHGQLGLEPTFQLYLDHMIIVCAEVKRVMKKTGSFWLNMGDTYGGSWQNFGSREGGQRTKSTQSFERKDNPQFYPPTARIMQKCLIGIPWRLILRLVDEQNWILRNCIIWSKPNAMPSSVKDRCSNSYEFLFHLVKAKKYYYDLDAIRDPHKQSSIERANYPVNAYAPKGTGGAKLSKTAYSEYKKVNINTAGKNPGDCWLIPTQSRPEAHFATFPDKLCIKPILATCPAEICKKCGKARVRITKTINPRPGGGTRNVGDRKDGYTTKLPSNPYAEKEFIGWTSCNCNAGWDSGVLLDPFAGRGTALIMAKKLGRHYIGYELKREYCEKLIKPALEEIDPLFNWKTPSPVAG